MLQTMFCKKNGLLLKFVIVLAFISWSKWKQLAILHHFNWGRFKCETRIKGSTVCIASRIVTRNCTGKNIIHFTVVSK